MEQRFTVDLDAEQAAVFALVADLGRYRDWLDLVHRVDPADDGRSSDSEGVPAWYVTLRAKVGPFARSKRLRMIRTVHEPDRAVRFERSELDGRSHSAWVLDSLVAPGSTTPTTVTMTLSYDGGLWSPVLGGLLEANVATASRNLQELATS